MTGAALVRSLSGIVSASPTPMAVLFGRNGEHYANPALHTLLGSAPGNENERNAFSIWPELEETIVSGIEAARRGQPASFERLSFYTNRDDANKRIWLNMSFSPAGSGSGKLKPVFCVVQDVTEAVECERRLSDMESRFTSLADSISHFAWFADETGYIYWYNKRWFQYTGTTLEEMQGWGWKSVQHPDHVDRVVERFTACVHEGRQWEDTFPLRSRNGEYRWFLSRAFPVKNEAGEIIRWVGTNTDVTEQRKEMEVNAQLAAIVSTSADAIISVSGDGRIRSWNPGAEQMLGYKSEDIIGEPEALLFEDPSDLQNERDKLRMNKGESLSLDATRRHKDGHNIDVSVDTAPLQLPTNELGYSTIMRDITERKKNEEKTRILLRELSHRTKNLLAVILSMVRQTARRSITVDQFQQQLEKRISGLAASHDLLVAQDWSGANLDELITAILKPFTTRSDHKVKMEGPSVFVTATAAQNLGLALHELSTNAQKYGALSVPGGEINIVWTLEKAQDENEGFLLVVRWHETGVKDPDRPMRPGFGHKIIETVVARALMAKVDYEISDTGVHWVIRLPSNFIVLDKNVQAASLTV